MQRHFGGLSALSLCFFVVVINSNAQAPERINPFAVFPRDRVIRPIDDQRRVALSGNRHPLARSEFETKPVSANFRMDRMMLVLKPDSEQQAALDTLVAEQYDPDSPFYQQWITPERYGELFGASEGDIDLIVGWLQSHGMKVEEVAAGRRSIIFNGTANQVRSAFHTRIQTYKINGELHHANQSDPEIPQALTGVVDGLVSLHDFRAQPMHVMKPTNPGPSTTFSSGASHYLTPGDFATIYNLTPLYHQLP